MFSDEGRLHRSRNVRFARASSPRQSGRLRVGRCQDHEAGVREEHVRQETLHLENSIIFARRTALSIIISNC